MTFVAQERLKKEMLIFIDTWTKLRNKNNLKILEKISEVRERQRCQTLGELKTAVQKSLWFAFI